MDRRKRQRRLNDISTAAAAAAIDSQQCDTTPPQQQQQQPTVEQQVPDSQLQQQQQADEVPADHQLLQELPEALLTQIVLAGGTQRHLHGALAAVCQDWRRFLLQNTKQLSVGLTSQAGAASLAVWLSKHAAALEQLDMTTVGLFGRNCSPDTRLRLFEALHSAAAVGVYDLEHESGSLAGSDDSDSDSEGNSSSSQQSGSHNSSSREGSGSDSGDSSNSGGEGAGSEAHDSQSSGESIPLSTDSPVPTPVPGGLFAGCAHLSTPSPTGDLIAAAAAAASADASDGAVAGPDGDAAAGPSQQQLDPQQQQQQQQQFQTPTRQQRPLRQSLRQQQQSTPQQQQQSQEPQQQQLQLQQLSANMRLTPADCGAIASLPAPQLRSLWLLGSRTRRLAIEGVRCLAGMTQLTSLKLQQFSIGDEATVLLAKGLTGLQLLHLGGNNIGAVGAAAISQHCTNVEQLDLSINRINAAALAPVCGALHCLRDLNLAGNGQLDASALQHLQQLTVLSRLTVSSSNLSNQDLSAICSALPQLQYLDAGNNRITKADPLTALVSLTSLNLSRNPLQLNCSKVFAAMPLQTLVLFDSAPARAISHLAGSALTQQLLALTLGQDPSLNPEGSDESLQLAKTRTCGALFGALAEAGRLRVLSVPCTGLGDAQGKLLSRLGASLQVLNMSYNCLSPAGLKVLRELPQLERLELRAMRPELPDAAIVNIISCSRLTHLDLAHNDITSEGVKQLGHPALANLAHLDLRNNAQVEKWAVLSAAAHLTRLTHLNLMEVSDVRARAFPRPSGPGSRSAAAAATPGGQSPGSSAARGRRGAAGGAAAAGSPASGAAVARTAAAAAGASAGGAGVRRPHADVWAALPNLEELSVEAENEFASRGTRFCISTL